MKDYFNISILLYFLFCFSRCCNGEIYAIKFDSQFYFEEFEDQPSTFGGRISDGVVRGVLVPAEPAHGCNASLNPPPPDDNDTGKWILLVARYSKVLNCTFEQKVRVAQAAGYSAVVVYNIGSNSLIPMGAENSTGIFIPSAFVGESSGRTLERSYANSDYFIVITAESPFNIKTHLLIPFAIVVGVCFIVLIIFMVVKYIKDRRRQRRHRLPTSSLNKIPTCKYKKGDPYETCAICLDDYVEGEKLRVLPCNHVYHTKCIDPWLTKNRRVCPICKRKVFAQDESQEDFDTDSEPDDTTPLVGSNTNRNNTQGGTFEQQTENPLQRVARSISQTRGAEAATLSDRHSVNGEYLSCDDSIVDSQECLVHREDSGSDVRITITPDTDSSPSRSSSQLNV